MKYENEKLNDEIPFVLKKKNVHELYAESLPVTFPRIAA